MLTDKHTPLATFESNSLINKHNMALDLITNSPVGNFGEFFLSKHKRKLGELTNEGKLK